MVSSIEQLRKRLGPSWEPTDVDDLQTLGNLMLYKWMEFIFN